MDKQDGFSLIEVIVTMAIAAIVLSIAVPSFQSNTQNNRQTTAINDLATALQLARNSAVTRQVRVTLCKSSDGANCQTGANSDWSQGWMMFTNPNNIAATSGLTSTETLLRVHATLPGSATLIGSGPTVNRISFKPQGLVDGNLGTITHCDPRGASHASALVVSFGGQVRQAVDDDDDGIVENGSGDPVLCPI